MKAAVFRGIGSIELADVPVPEPGKGEVLVRVQYCGICGSDMEAFHTGIYLPGVILGHEFAGVIEAVGEGVSGRAAGDRVTSDSIIPCDRCWFCRHGRPTLCQEFVTLGVSVNGGMAEYVCLPDKVLHRLPDNVSTRDGALLEPLSIALHGVRSSAFQKGDRGVLVLGAGTIGLLVIQCLTVSGAEQIVVTECKQNRIDLALKLGATAVLSPQQDNLADDLRARTDGLGPDVVFVCTGAASAFQDALTVVRKGGQVFALGLCVEPVQVNFLSLVLGEIDVRGGFEGCDVTKDALDLLAAHRVKVEPLISHEIGLTDIKEMGFEEIMRLSEEGVKVLVRI